MDNIFEEMSFSMANPDYYFPLVEAGSNSKPYNPSIDMSSWESATDGVWQVWSPPQMNFIPSAGWKIHVSSSVGDADAILDRVARSCMNFRTSFKHLGNEFYFCGCIKNMPADRRAENSSLYIHAALRKLAALWNIFLRSSREDLVRSF
jgi:hypothetical protein